MSERQEIPKEIVLLGAEAAKFLDGHSRSVSFSIALTTPEWVIEATPGDADDGRTRVTFNLRGAG